MEKRIRIIWILSLVSVLLLIGLQGYWLYSQYQYVSDNYLQELSEDVLNAGEEEHRIRKSNIKTSYTYIIDRTSQYIETDTSKNRKAKLLFTLSRSDNHSLGLQGDNDSIEKNKERIIRNEIDTLMHNYIGLRDKSLPSGTKYLNLLWDSNMSEKDSHVGIERAVTNFNNPFRPEYLDSVLKSDLPGISFSIVPQNEKDTFCYHAYWEKTGSVFHTRMLVFYPYSPLQQEGVFIYADIPSQPLFARMAKQLILALCVVLLLIGCLIFQIRTIMKQQKLSELREHFVNTMIHELKRPVQTLKTFISFLGDKDMRSDEIVTGQVVQDSMFELDNLSAYLNKLKDMVRADSENTSLNLVRFNLQELTEKIIRLIHIPARKKVKLTTQYEMESPWIEADPVHIANILSNLIENAIKYSGNEVVIHIAANRKGKELWLTVTDNGIGIPFAEQEKVFVKFYRGSNILDKNIPGIGLGLSYVKLIMEAHHGNISLVSHYGEGTSVTLYLPQ